MAMTSTPREAEVATAGRSEFAVEIEVPQVVRRVYVLRDVDLQVATGRAHRDLRPSVSGQIDAASRCINGLEPYQRGEVSGRRDCAAQRPQADRQVRREVGMVFSAIQPVPHLTVLENCTLAPIHVRKIPQGEAEASARRFLDRVRILRARPAKSSGQLSGGQQQRVATRGALCMNPSS